VAGLLLIPLTVAVGIAFARLVVEADDVPTDDDVAAAARAAAVGLGDDDAIVVLPPWSLRPLAALGPLASRVVGSDGPAGALLDGRFRRVVAIVEPDATPWRAVLQPLGPPTASARHGAIVVERYDGGGPARFDLLAALPAATITLDDTVCLSPVVRGVVRGVACAGDAPVRVTREHALVTENGRLVVRVTPPPPGQRLAVTLTVVPLGDRLVVAAGHTRAGVERPDGDVFVDVLIDGRVVATLRRAPSFVVEPSRAARRAAFVRPVSPEGEGFRADVIDTRAWPGMHSVAFVVRSTGSRVDADFGLDAFVPGGDAGAAGGPR
jgi:hypothetical protein